MSRHNSSHSRERQRSQSPYPGYRRRVVAAEFRGDHVCVQAEFIEQASSHLFQYMAASFVFALTAVQTLQSVVQLYQKDIQAKSSLIGLALSFSTNLILGFSAAVLLKKRMQSLDQVDYSHVSPIANESLHLYAPALAVALPICFQVNQFAYEQVSMACASSALTSVITCSLLGLINKRLQANLEANFDDDVDYAMSPSKRGLFGATLGDNVSQHRLGQCDRHDGADEDQDPVADKPHPEGASCT